MRGRVVVIAILAVAAIGISLWQPWRDAAPAPADVSAEAGAAGEQPAAAAPPAAPPRKDAAPDAGTAAPPGARLTGRLAARDAGAAAPDAADDENRARFRALHQAMVTATPEASRLYGAFVRSRVPAPPEAQTLVAMKQRGVPQDELIAFVKSNFHDLPARAIALRWLGVGAGAGVSRPAAAGQPPAAPATGTLVRRDAG
jgi:hypothetical protein